MKRSNVDKIFIEETNRKHKIFACIALITIISVLVCSFFIAFLKKNKKEYINYSETSAIDYQVYLKENDFFKERYLGKDRNYIASLIDYINAQFKYNIQLDKKGVDFDYSTRIEADVEVFEVNGKKPLYKVTETLLKDKQGRSNSEKNVGIAENIKIDYNHYNDLIKEFKKTYGLSNVVSTLTINMYVSVKGNCDDLEDNPDSQSVISLIIPLTEKTVSIEMESNLVETHDGLLVCRKVNNSVLTLIISIVLLGIDALVIILTGIYAAKTRSPRDIYERELKKILNNYHSFIQKINNDFDLDGYQILKVDTFTDMLEIRDTLGQPILMVESKEKNGVHFIIPSATKLLYTYTLKEQDIKKQREIKNFEI